MRINEETVLVGSSVILVPYRKEHVVKYHEWMSSEEIRQQTASEPLTLEEEFAMQESWRLDDDKLTFIVLARRETDCDDVSSLLKACPMVGDVNLFLSERHMDDAEEGGAPVISALDAELEVMIAEPAWRKKGLAVEALSLLIHYASTKPTPAPEPGTFPSAPTDFSSHPIPLPLPPDAFLAKVGFDNQASLHLFAKLGFQEIKRSEVWREIELRKVDGADRMSSLAQRPLSILRWPLSSP